MADDPVHRRDDHRRAVFVDDLAEPLGADPGPCLLRFDVAHALLRPPAISEHEVEHLAVPLPPSQQPDRRNDQSLLVDVARRRRIDLRPMSADRAERNDLAFREHRNREQHVGKMRVAAAIGVVLDDRVPLLERVQRNALQNALERERHGCEMHGDVAAPLRDELGVRRQDRARNIARILPKRRHRRPDHHVLHLAGHGQEGVPDDFESDRVNLARAHATPPAQ